MLQRDIADVGFYSFISTAEEAERLASDPAARDELLHELMNERVEAWMRPGRPSGWATAPCRST